MIQPQLADLIAAAPAVLFDFDGVVVDSEPLHYEAYRQVFAELGHDLDPDEYWVHWTDRGESIAGEIERHGLTHLDADGIARRKREMWHDWCRAGRLPFCDGALDTLRAYADAPRPAAIASNTGPADIEAIFSAAGEQSPVPIVGRTDGLRSKPHPDIFLEAARVLDVRPQGCVVFEDARKGIEAAVAAGMIPVVVRGGINRNFTYPEAPAEVDGLAAARGAANAAMPKKGDHDGR